MYNNKESFPALRRAVCCLLLTSMLLAALLGFAMPASAAGSNDTPPAHPARSFYAYTATISWIRTATAAAIPTRYCSGSPSMRM